MSKALKKQCIALGNSIVREESRSETRRLRRTSRIALRLAVIAAKTNIGRFGFPCCQESHGLFDFYGYKIRSGGFKLGRSIIAGDHGRHGE